MKIGVVTPIMRGGEEGGAEVFYRGLVQALRRASYDVDQITVVIDETTFETILESYVTCYDLDLSQYDLVISTKAPTYMLRHPNHISYFVHTIRVFYDMFHEAFGEGTPELHAQRQIIHAFDKHGLHPDRVRRYFTIGHTPYLRLCKADPFWQKISYQVLPPPPPPGSEFFKEPRPGEYIFLPGRLHRWKRVDLIIKAFKYIKYDIPLKIAGIGEDEVALRKLAAGDPRIEFLGHVSDEQLRELYASALVVPFVPFNEDYGFITIEAFRSKKPVITCTDSGEPTYFVKNFATGFVVAPDPMAIAEKLTYCIEYPEQAAEMGGNGEKAISHITWETTISRLIASDASKKPIAVDKDAAEGLNSRVAEKPTKVLVTDNQVLDPPVGGGRLRIYHLCKNLARVFPITYVGAYDWPGERYREQILAPNFTEIILPLTQVHFRLNAYLQRLAGGQVVIDVTMPWLLKYTPRFSDVVNAYAQDAHVIIVSHPWVYRYVKRRHDQLLVYDAHNCEYRVKKNILKSSLIARLLVRKIQKVEKELCRSSDLIFACSEDDKVSFIDLYGIKEDKIFVIPNGVDTQEIQPAVEWEREVAKREVGMRDKRTILFVGSGYKPNVEALDFIVNHLAFELPDCHFLIMGGVGDLYMNLIDTKIPSNVKLFGVVDTSLRNIIYRASDIAINPMFSGSGTNIKMFDYMAAGLPIVTTLIGARGIDNINNTFIISEKDDLAKHIRITLNSKEIYETMSRNGRSLAEAKFDWKVIAEQAYEVIKCHINH